MIGLTRSHNSTGGWEALSFLFAADLVPLLRGLAKSPELLQLGETSPTEERLKEQQVFPRLFDKEKLKDQLVFLNNNL